MIRRVCCSLKANACQYVYIRVTELSETRAYTPADADVERKGESPSPYEAQFRVRSTLISLSVVTDAICATKNPPRVATRAALQGPRMSDDFVLLESADGFTFVVPRKVACASGTLKSMLDEEGRSEMRSIPVRYS
jgi:hypothetical protein